MFLTKETWGAIGAVFVVWASATYFLPTSYEKTDLLKGIERIAGLLVLYCLWEGYINGLRTLREPL